MAAGAKNRLEAGEHVVHFYADDAQLLGVVGTRLRAAADAGDTVLTFTTPEHRPAFARAVGDRLRQHDATAVASRLSDSGDIDPALFESEIGTVVRRAVAGGRPVHVYGEIVALLWQAGNVAGALVLEELWNELAADVPFALACGYPAQLMAVEDADAEFAQVCAAHSEVLAGAPLPAEHEAGRRFPCSVRAPRDARNFVAGALRDWDRGDLVEVATLVVTELAVNAVTHAGSGFTVALTRHGNTVRLAVGDTEPMPPRRRNPEALATSGRGLLLVEAMSSDWGHRTVPGGKLVWADLAATR